MFGGSNGKESACDAGDPGGEDALEKEVATHSSIPAWRAPVHGVAESQARLALLTPTAQTPDTKAAAS